MSSYDTIVIGGGPGGYVAAIRAAQLGQKTAVVERDKPGGRCLNYACIPAKTVLHTAEVFATVSEDGADLGIKASGVSIDWPAVQKRRETVSKTLADGVQMLWKKNKIDFLAGEGKLAGDGKVEVDGETHDAKAIVLATGSVAMPIPGIEFSDRVIDTWGAWSLEKLPKALVVAGAGASGAEIASAYARMGVEVTLVEMLDQILPAEDKDMARVVERQFKKDGIEVKAGTKVEGVTEQKTGVKVKVGDEELKADYLVIAGGRAPDVEALGLDAAGVKTGDGGKIEIDEYQQTSAEGRLRDRRPGARPRARPQGLRGGRRRGRARRRRRHPPCRHEPDRRRDLLPPAGRERRDDRGAGEGGRQADQGRQVQARRRGASVVYDDRAGLVKIVGDPEYGEILGAHIVGNIACDMIAELVNTMALEGGYTELGRIVHPHPTMSEAVLDAALAVDGLRDPRVAVAVRARAGREAERGG